MLGLSNLALELRDCPYLVLCGEQFLAQVYDYGLMVNVFEL